MKVTKSQLRRIIREEKRKVLAENRVRRLVRRALREQTQTIDDWFERRSRMDAKDDILSMVSEDEVIEAGWADREEAYYNLAQAYLGSGEEEKGNVLLRYFQRLQDNHQEMLDFKTAIMLNIAEHIATPSGASASTSAP